MTYAIGFGWNVDDGDLVEVSPQPRNGEVQYTQSIPSDGGLVDHGLFSRPVWDMFESDAEFQDVLAQFDVLENEERRITWRTQDDTFAWKRYNGLAVKPKPVDDGGRDNFFLRNHRILIRDLVEIE